MDFIASYPESGSTWIRLVHAAYHADSVSPSDLMRFDEEEGLVGHLMQYSDADPYYYQSVCPFPIEKTDLYTRVRLRPAAMFVLEREVSLAPAPPLVQSHHLHGRADAFSLWNSQWTDKVVNPVRDPREICCLLYADHSDKSYQETAEFMAEGDARIDGDDTGRTQYFLSTWSNHVEGWLNAEDLSVFSVHYEDLRMHPVDALYDIFEFLEVPGLDKARVREAVEKTQPDALQAAGADHGSPEPQNGQGGFLRSGEAQGWKDELPTDVARKIEEDHGEMMTALGYL